MVDDAYNYDAEAIIHFVNCQVEASNTIQEHIARTCNIIKEHFISIVNAKKSYYKCKVIYQFNEVVIVTSDYIKKCTNKNRLLKFNEAL